MHQFLLNEGADPRVFCLFSAMPIACSLLKNGNDAEKCPSRQQELSLATVTARVANPVPVIISGTLRCSACRLESSGTGVTDDPRTATTGNQRGLFTYPGKPPEQAPETRTTDFLVTLSGEKF